MPRRSKAKDQSGPVNGLTPIPHGIHCAATSVDSYVNEQDEIDIDNFLDTLAEVAMAIAARKLSQAKDGE